jgi:hypothetical protein
MIRRYCYDITAFITNIKNYSDHHDHTSSLARITGPVLQ